MLWTLIINTLCILILAHLALGVILWLRVRKLYSYPGLLGFPIFGNLYYFYKTMFLFFIESLDKNMVDVAKKHGEKGLCFHWVYGSNTLAIVSSPQVVKELAYHPSMADKPDSMFAAFTSYLEGPFVTWHSDESWKQKRKEYNIGLKRSKIDNSYCNSFIKGANKLAESMLASGKPVSALSQVLVLTQNATMETFFGIETSLASHPQIINCTIFSMKAGSFVVANPILAKICLTVLLLFEERIFKKLVELRKLVTENIEKTLASEQPPLSEQPLAMQMVTRSRNTIGTTKTWTILDIYTEIQELFATSSQTVASVLSSSLILLAVLPDIQERAWQEQYEIFGDDKRDPSVDDMKAMQFLDRYIKESMRFFSPPYFMKLATEDIHINGMIIPQGTNVAFLSRYIRMDPKHWEKPEIFNPDRFLEESDMLQYSYTPFGIGVRNCPGMYYATLQMKIALSKILRRIKLKPVQKDFRFEDICFKPSIATEIKNPPMLQVEERI